MSDADLIPLAAGFAPSTHDAWMRLVEKTLNGADFDTLRSRTADGLVIEPLYAEASPSPVRPSFSGDPARPWDLRAPVGHPDAAEANGQALDELENGAASLLLRVADPADLERVLQGVELDLAPVALDAGWAGPQAAERLAALAKGGPQAQPLFHLDPLSALAEQGSSPGPIKAHLTLAASTAVQLADTYPRARLFLASGRAVHEAGGTEAQELGFVLAAGLGYARALMDAGMPLQQAFARVTLGLSADAAYFVVIAKLRAARLLWAKLTTACEAATPAVIEARSSRRMLARQDAWSNMLRLTAAGFGAGLGGADAIVLEAFTAPLGAPTTFARRQARNIQLVLMEEANLGRVSDPAGGSGFVETLTDQLARAGWATFQEIERCGGAVAALTSGHLAARVKQAREARCADYAEGRAKLIGVTLFPDPDAPPPAVHDDLDQDHASRNALDVALPGPDTHAPALTPLRWASAFEDEEAGDGR